MVICESLWTHGLRTDSSKPQLRVVGWRRESKESTIRYITGKPDRTESIVHGIGGEFRSCVFSE